MSPYSICIPYQPDGGLRDFIFEWTLARWQAICPNADICIGSDDSGDVLLNRSRMRNNAVKQAKSNIIFIPDADAFIANVSELTEITDQMPGAGLVSYNRYFPLSQSQTVDVLSQEPGEDLILPPVTDRDLDLVYGFFFGMTRHTFDSIHGFDERFSGWGCEDPAAVLTIETLVGPVRRITRNIYHLWHPPSPEKDSKNPDYKRNEALWNKYRTYEGNPKGLRRFIQGSL